MMITCSFFFSSRRRHTRCSRDWSSDVCSSDLNSGRVAGDEKIGHFALTSIHRLWTAENELRHERQRKEFLDLSLRPKCARLQMCRHPSAPEPALLFCHHCANSACMAK